MRLEPTVATVKRLFALSGNRCAFPGCSNAIIDSDSNVLGRICHIEAAEQGGPRYNSSQSDQERRAFGNLILLCANHHIITDDVNRYSVEHLKQVKTQHEKKWHHNPAKVSVPDIQRMLSELRSRQEVVNLGPGTQVFSQQGAVTYHQHGPSIVDVIRLVTPLLEAQFSRFLEMHLPIVRGKLKKAIGIENHSVRRSHSAATLNVTMRTQSRKSTPPSEATRIATARAALDLITESKLSLNSATLRKRVVAALKILRPGESEYSSFSEERLLAGQLRAYHAWMLTGDGQLDAAEVELDISRLILGRGSSLEAATLQMMARQHFKAGRLTRAASLSREAIAIFKRLNRDPSMVSICLSDLGAFVREQNHLAEAAGHFEEACAIEERLGHRGQSAALSFESGRLWMIFGECAKAIPLLEMAVRRYGELGDENGLCVSLSILAVTLHRNNDQVAAHERAEAARTVGLKLSDDVLFRDRSATPG